MIYLIFEGLIFYSHALYELSADDCRRLLENSREVAQIVGGQKAQSMRKKIGSSKRLELYILLRKSWGNSRWGLSNFKGGLSPPLCNPCTISKHSRRLWLSESPCWKGCPANSKAAGKFHPHFPAARNAIPAKVWALSGKGKVAAPSGTLLDFLLRGRHSLLELF